jgi:hypothetical protein
VIGAAAVGFALLTVLIGTLILADVSGPRSAAPPRPLLVSHVVAALAATLVLGVGAATANVALSWGAVAVTAVAATFGIVALRRTLAVARSTDRTRPSNGMLIVHGVAAAVTIVLAVVGAAVSLKLPQRW